MTESIENKPISKKVESFHPNYVNIDERSIKELMQAFVSYAKQIPFINENGDVLGQWDEMYTEQTLFLWVDIASLDISSIENKKKTILEFWDSDGEPKSVSLIIESLQILKSLYDKAHSSNVAWVLEEIKSVIGGVLSMNIFVLKEDLIRLSTTSELSDLATWIEWLEKSKIDFEKNSLKFDRPRSKKEVFNDIINDVINCLFTLQSKTKGKDFNTMLKNGKHSAHVSLLFGFLKSYQSIQKQINDLPKRHIDYYYKTILKQKLLKAEPDYAYVFSTIAPGINETTIEKGSAFYAGQDNNGNDIIFENGQKIQLTETNITELKTLLFNKNKYIKPLDKAQMVTGVYMDSIPLNSIKKERDKVHAWPLFGEPQNYKKNRKLPDLGWAVASPVFNLASGKRTVKLSYKIEKESIKACSTSLDSLIVSTNVSRQEVLHRFINDAFKIEITTAKGWLNIQDYASRFTNTFNDEDNCCLEITFSLLPNLPAWVAYNEDIHLQKFNSKLPLLSFKLKQDSVYYSFSFLSQLKVETLNIDVSVNDFKDFIVYNKHGLVDPANPFPVLGVNPLQGNRFYVGANEWLYKSLHSIKLNIEWVDLPKPNFETYYKDYQVETITDDSFKMKLTDYTFNNESENLFVIENGILKQETNFKELKIDKPASSIVNNNPELLSPNTNPLAFIGLELVQPYAGFGSTIYQQEMALYAQRSIKNRKKNEQLFPPNIPYIPLARSLNVNYKTKQAIPFKSISNVIQTEAFDFYHIHPFGITKEGDEKTINSRSLLPEEYEDKGYLFIGLENAKQFTEISIFLKLIPSTEPLSEDNLISISYLSGELWIDIGENEIENTTIEGQETGIIRLFLPLDLESNHPLFDKNKDWIRLSIDSSNLKHIGSCVYVNTNVGLVKRRLENVEASFKVLKPLEINGLLSKNASVLSVVQPFSSFGGHQREEESEFYARVSNRLGHKNRMVRPRDYKRMILEKFSEVNWIKVLTSSNYFDGNDTERVAPGTVKLIVMPKINEVSDFSSFYIHKHTQIAIKDYVLKHCAPGLNIEIESPEYEEIEVRCRLIRKNKNEYIPYSELEKIISQIISPWLFYDKLDYKHVEAKFSVSNLVHAISQHPKVKNVDWCQVIRISKDAKLSSKFNDHRYTYFDSFSDGDIVSPSNGKAILVPAKEFKIYQSEKEYAKYKKLAQGVMDVEETFIVTTSKREQVAFNKTLESKNTSKPYYLLNLKNM